MKLCLLCVQIFLFAALADTEQTHLLLSGNELPDDSYWLMATCYTKSSSALYFAWRVVMNYTLTSPVAHATCNMSYNEAGMLWQYSLQMMLADEDVKLSDGTCNATSPRTGPVTLSTTGNLPDPRSALPRRGDESTGSKEGDELKLRDSILFGLLVISVAVICGLSAYILRMNRNCFSGTSRVDLRMTEDDVMYDDIGVTSQAGPSQKMSLLKEKDEAECEVVENQYEEVVMKKPKGDEKMAAQDETVCSDF